MSAALAGITLLDFSRFLPGAYPGWIAGDLGADIIRVEHPRELAKLGSSGGDPVLARARPTYHRNKRSLTLNPTHPDARVVLDRLIARADILIEDYRPGVMAAMGLGPDVVRAANPRLIYCSVSFGGQTGPAASMAGHDPGALALSGALSRLNGTARPTLPSVQVADVLAGSHATIAMLAALQARALTGRGDHIDVAMTDACLPLLMVALGRADDASRLGPSDGSFDPKGGVWECADGRYLCTTDLELPYWQRFCAAIDRPDLTALRDDPARWPELERQIAAVLRTRPRDEWVAHLQAAQTQATPVLSPAEAMSSALARERGMKLTVPTSAGDVTQIATPFHMTESSPRPARAAPLPGADTDAILEELGFGSDEIARLHASGAFTSTERG